MLVERLVERVSRRMRVIADPQRMRILAALEQKPYAVQELADLLGRSHQSTSHHLNALFGEGVVDRQQDGTRVVYCLADFTVCRLLLLAQEGVVAQLEELGELASIE